MKLIVGLGNPGKAYTYTRHNIGFLVIDQIADKSKKRFHKACNGLMTEVDIEGFQCSLLMPQTMMNDSGLSVRAAVVKLGIKLQDLVIIYDDMAIAFGALRIRPEGSAGGHNGIKSIISHLGTMSFTRLRLGVGRPPVNVDPADHVLANFTSSEQKCLPDFLNQASFAVHSWVTEGVIATMNEHNGNRKKG